MNGVKRDAHEKKKENEKLMERVRKRIFLEERSAPTAWRDED